ncbi:MAG: hypothetical protein U9P79_06380 [Candidatus Cloacimonadota bacterium]|nr:hypothetical protein [Candidatus Cloacimonadota bacterium]
MILYDWKQRLKKDSKDFVENKIPAKDYDFEIIYNAYPERVDGEISGEIITYVAKQMGRYMTVEPEPFLPFLKFIRKNKKDVGVKVYNYIMRDIIKKNPGEYDDLFVNFIKSEKDYSALRNMFDFLIFPLLKKHPDKYVDKIIGWINIKSSDILIKNIFRIICRYLQSDKTKVRGIFQKCESYWNINNEAIRDGNIKLLKTIFKVDEDYYREIYGTYKSTYNPNFVEILSHAICENVKIIEEDIKNWEESGNTRIKEAGKVARRNIERLKR